MTDASEADDLEPPDHLAEAPAPAHWTLPAPYYRDDLATIYHGDTLMVLSQLEPFQALITDPPYSSGGQFRSDRVQSTNTKYVNSDTQGHRPDFAGDNRDQRSFMRWSEIWLTQAYHAAASSCVVAVFTDWRQLPTLTDALQVAGWVWRGVAVWDKTEGVRPRFGGGFSAQCEYVVVGTKGPAPETAYLPGCFRCASPRGDRDHIAQKPVEVLHWLCRVCPPGGLVVDPFLGSGTTLRAAKNLGLRSVGIETDPQYLEPAARRLPQESIIFTPPPVVEQPGLLDPPHAPQLEDHDPAGAAP